MTAQTEDETLAWAREIASDLEDSGSPDAEILLGQGPADPEADVLAAMASLPEHWKRYIADIAQRVAGELAEHPQAVPSAGRHRSPGDD